MAVLRRSWASLYAVLLGLYFLITPVVMVKEENFKTCDQSGFCKRNRGYADEATRQGKAWTSPFRVVPESISFKNSVLQSSLLKTINSTTGETREFKFSLIFLQSGGARFVIDEEARRNQQITLRHDSKARKERYSEVNLWALEGTRGLKVDKAAGSAKDAPKGHTHFVWGDGGTHQARIRHDPFAVDFLVKGETMLRFNERGLLNAEHWRAKVEQEKTEEKKPEEKKDPIVTADAEGSGEDGAEDYPEDYAGDIDDSENSIETSAYDESTWWEETFGGDRDSKPRGPESMGMDITFAGFEHVYGIPEHTGPMSLKQTRGGDGNFDDPYRLYNLDVFEYIMDSPMALYGAIPYMQAHRKGSSVGVFWMNAAETWVDITKTTTAANPLSLGIGAHTDTQTHWFSESGVMDVFVLLGPTPKDNAETWGELTGYSQLPPMFSLGYHQCRWNYISDDDVRDVDRKFDKHQIPYDVIWLDIEYTDGKKYFTWDSMKFKDPIGMQKQLDDHERKLVAIIDPHIKKEDGYKVVEELKSKNLAPTDKSGKIYEGWCWPGSSHWVDCFNPKALEWWKTLFKYDKFVGSAPNMHIWNDMNEPSVFNGPETTMPKDNLHYGNWEHRDIHNLNGLTFQYATFNALLDRDGATKPAERKRPFVLTRSFYAGSQRYGAMWTGDNLAEWSHLEASLPMVMANGVSGYPFAGADVGGFFGNPSKELLTRWYQAGAFYPFMRGHAHIDARRREPYLAGEPYTGIITQALRLRYSLLPTWYTTFHAASTKGHPIVRPNWYVHPEDDKGFAIDDQMYLGESGLLVKPVTKEGGDSVDIYLADAATYYDYYDFTAYSGSAGRTAKIAAPLEKLPLLMQSGRIFARRDRPRRSSGLMKWDPYTLVVVLDSDADSAGGAQEKAAGELYVDDGESYEHTEGAFVHRRFSVTRPDGKLQLMSSDVGGAQGKKAAAYAQKTAAVLVDKIVVVGAPAAWKGLKHVSISEEGPSASGASRQAALEFVEGKGGRAAHAVVKKPALPVSGGWKITF